MICVGVVVVFVLKVGEIFVFVLEVVLVSFLKFVDCVIKIVDEDEWV